MIILRQQHIDHKVVQYYQDSMAENEDMNMFLTPLLIANQTMQVVPYMADILNVKKCTSKEVRVCTSIEVHLDSSQKMLIFSLICHRI